VMRTLLCLSLSVLLLALGAAPARAQGAAQVNARLSSGIVKLGSPAALLLEVGIIKQIPDLSKLADTRFLK